MLDTKRDIKTFGIWSMCAETYNFLGQMRH
jgi:hypothetical protein